QRIKEKKEQRKAAKLGKLPPKKQPKKQPHTIESLREKDVTMVEEEDEELDQEEATDAFSSYFTKSYVPKVLVTCSDNPHTKTIAFIRELCRMIPDAKPMWRKRSRIEKIIKTATENGFTDVVIVNEDRRIPNGLMVIHLPEGPTALFRVSNPKLCKEIHRSHQEISNHR
ncbi:hypothetical protein OTU49_003855, partial [Cherax quadricarinatus]